MTDERIIENIKKLKSLGMANEEIIDNLVKIGLSKEESEKLVLNSDVKKEENKTSSEKIILEKKEETKTTESKIKKEEVKKQKEEIPDDFFNTSKGDILDDSIENIDEDILKEEEPLPEFKNEIKDTNNSKDDLFDLNIDFKNKNLYKETKPVVENLDDENINNTENVWKKGFITIINSKLTELETKQKIIEENITNTLEKEISKIKETHEKTKKEILKTINTLLTEEIDKTNLKIITELAKFKVIEVKLNSKVQKIEEDKFKIQEIIKDFELVKTQFKENLIEDKKRTDMLIQDTQENISKMASTITVKLNDKIKEINSTLSLQSKITEGLVKNTKNTLILEIKKLNEFKENVQQQIDPKKIYDKISELEDFKIKLSNRYQERFEKVKDEFLQKAKIAINNEVENDLLELRKIRTEIVEKTDPEKIDKKLIELKGFEENLANSIDTKIEKSLKIYEASITTEFKNKMTEIEDYKKYLEKNIELQKSLEYKIKEIDNFKKQFIAVIDENIEKMNRNMSMLMELKK